MASIAIKKIQSQVDDIASLPKAPQSAACVLLRQRIWEAVFKLQNESEPANSFWQLCQKQEVVNTCEALQPLVCKLQYLEQSSRFRTSNWLLTDYAALSKEIRVQRNLAEELLSTTEDWGVDDIGPSFKVFCGCRWSGNMQVLALTFLLFTTITTAQTIGALISNSEALLADCVSMAVDSSTYLANMLAESQKGTRLHRWLQLLIPALSLSLLIYFTVDVMKEAVGTLESDADDGDDDDVDPFIVLGFGLCGIIFDFASLYAFVKNQRRNGAASINMVAAFMHVAADFARSMTTSIESILLFIFTDWNGSIIDAWACIVVSVIILGGAIYGLFEWCQELRTFIRAACESRRESRQRQRNEDLQFEARFT